MATRFRLPASGAAPVSPALQSYSHTQTTRRPLPTSDATALATQAYTPDGADHLVAGDTHHVQLVSDALTAQTISAQTVKLCLQALEAHANNNLFIQLWIGVVSNDGSTALATLLAKTVDGVELATSLTARILSATTSSYTIGAGDAGARIVAEISVSGTPTAAGGTQGHNASIRFGSDGAGGDLLENDTETGTTRNPWLEFANALSFVPPPRVGRVTFAEIEAPNAPRLGKVSFAEAEAPNAPRRGYASFAEFEAPTAPRKGFVSFAETEVPTAPVSPRIGRVAFAESEVPTAPRTGRISFAETEAPTAPRVGRVAWAETEVANAPRIGRVAFTEVQLPDAPRVGRITWTEFEAPTAPRRGHVTFAEFEAPAVVAVDRIGRLTWAEAQVPTAPRAGRLSFAAFELDVADPWSGTVGARARLSATLSSYPVLSANPASRPVLSGMITTNPPDTP